MLVGNIEKDPKRYQDAVLCACLEIFFTPRRCQFKKKKAYLEFPSYIFWPNTLKVTAKAPAVNLLRLNTLRGTKTALLTLKR